MKRLLLFSALLVPLFFSRPCYAALETEEVTRETTQKIEAEPGATPLKKFEAQREEFDRKYGTSFAFIFHYDRQFILDAEDNKGKNSGLCYWNLEVMQKLWTGGLLSIEFETDRGKGADKFIPTLALFNSNTGENLDFYIPKLYLQQSLAQERIFLAAGKLDLSDWFDGSAVASSSDIQFVSESLVNNLTIPFPTKGLGAMFNLKPSDWFYLEAGAATAKAVCSKTGLSTGFNSAFFIAETGFTPQIAGLAGNYRFIYHLTHRTLEHLDESGTKKDTAGFAFSFDQAITRRFTLFARYGFANPKINTIEHFWSAGAQFSAPFESRKYDYLGLAVAHSITSREYRSYNEPDAGRSETLWELYYSCDLNHVFTITPHLQVVNNPNADNTQDTAVVAGVRFLCSF